MKATYKLPFPVSVNGMFKNIRRGRAKSAEYRAWELEAAAVLKAQRPVGFVERVEIKIDLDERRKGDAGNREKGVTDLLVSCGVIKDDSKRYVKRVSIGWEDVDGCAVHIQAVSA